jgi:hypothetical protein
MRPSTVARAVLTAALALGALPGLVGSHEPSHDRPIEAAAFRQVILATLGSRPIGAAAGSSDSAASEGALGPESAFTESGTAPRAARPRAIAALPKVSPAWDWKPPKYSLNGYASFYSNGTTAMRLPRGTVIVICGAAGCLERVVNDYGPAAYTGRIIDMYKPDFFAICGCGWWSGTTWVTVKVY